MSDPIILTVPEEISDRARQIAASTAQSIEQILLNHLKTLSSDPNMLSSEIQAELDALYYLSDDALLTIAREQMSGDLQLRAHELMDRNTPGQLTTSEIEELEQLVERGDRLMLRKAEAAELLKKRGYPFTQKDFKPEHE